LLPIIQSWIPQHLLSRFGGWLANCEIPRVKNYLIRYFLNRYIVNLQEAEESNPYHYPSFNAFFTRTLRMDVRPIAIHGNALISPADGTVSQIGDIDDGAMIQAKGHTFSVTDLLGGNIEVAATFQSGHFLTVYLAPQDYHRVHIPVDGTLTKMIYVPGRLFSVNTQTTQVVPNLFARNERVIILFNTSVGKVAVILVGAMIVGSIETVWAGTITPFSRRCLIHQWDYDNPIDFKRGDEIGHFKFGSTVIVLLEQKAIQWNAEIVPTQSVRMGQALGTLHSGVENMESARLKVP